MAFFTLSASKLKRQFKKCLQGKIVKYLLYLNYKACYKLCFIDFEGGFIPLKFYKCSRARSGP